MDELNCTTHGARDRDVDFFLENERSMSRPRYLYVNNFNLPVANDVIMNMNKVHTS